MKELIETFMLNNPRIVEAYTHKVKFRDDYHVHVLTFAEEEMAKKFKLSEDQATEIVEDSIACEAFNFYYTLMCEIEDALDAMANPDRQVMVYSLALSVGEYDRIKDILAEGKSSECSFDRQVIEAFIRGSIDNSPVDWASEVVDERYKRYALLEGEAA